MSFYHESTVLKVRLTFSIRIGSRSRLIYKNNHFQSGRISFTSHMPGEHTVCVFTNSTAWFSGQQLRVHLEMATGEHAVNYAQVAQEEKLTEIQLRIRQLLNQADQILKEQNYQRVSLNFIPTHMNVYSFRPTIQFVFYSDSSTVKRCSVGPVKAHMIESSIGLWLKYSSSFPSASGKCAIWKNSSKPKNWFNSSWSCSTIYHL